MISLKIVLNGDGILKDFPIDKVVHLTNGLTVTALEGGMESGLPSIGLIFDLPDGRKVFAETSLILFLSAADAMRAKFGDPRIPRRG
jgi:hypothetical protein